MQIKYPFGGLAHDNVAREIEFAKSLWGDLSEFGLRALEDLIQLHDISVMHWRR